MARPARTHYRLTFPDLPMEDGSDPLEVTISSMSVRQRLAFDAMRFTPVTSAAELTQRTRDLAAWLGSVLVSWTLQDDQGAPVPTTAEAILDQDEPLIATITAEAIAAITGVPRTPLAPAPTPGTAMHASIPMETLPQTSS